MFEDVAAVISSEPYQVQAVGAGMSASPVASGRAIKSSVVDVPETMYAKSGDVNIAYQVVGDAPLDLVFVMGWVSHLEYFWKEPSFARFLRRLASFARVIVFDKRGNRTFGSCSE